MNLSKRELEFCKNIGIEPSKDSPKDRLRYIMAFRNERRLYKRKCDISKETIISPYHEDSPFKIYNNQYWWGDKWDALEYGKDYDFSRPFFDQFYELLLSVPKEGTTIFNSENCEYNSHIRRSKNCYLCSLIADCEDLLYSHWMVGTKDSAECIYVNFSTLCYECGNLDNCYNCCLLWNSVNCNDCYGSYNLRGCKNCLFSSNLINKEYHLYNKPCSKEEFEDKLNEFINGSFKNFEKMKEEFKQVCDNSIHRGSYLINCENCSGDFLYNSRNCQNCFQGKGLEDCYNSASLGDSKDVFSSYSIGWQGCEQIYECCVMRGDTDCAFCNYCWMSNGLRYCDSCISSKDCFGCVGLKHKQYCILNKQYSKEEYEKLKQKIIEHMKSTGEWGKFFSQKCNQYAYNESCAYDFFPLSKEDALKMGWKWREKDLKEYLPASIDYLRDNIKDVDESILKELMACDNCGKNYKIVDKELRFYKRMNLPLPRLCTECRHQNRFKKTNPYDLFSRKCAKCRSGMVTTYSPDRPEIVYCESCYLDSLR